MLGDLHVSISLGMGFSITLKLKAGVKLPGSMQLYIRVIIMGGGGVSMDTSCLMSQCKPLTLLQCTLSCYIR